MQNLDPWPCCHCAVALLPDSLPSSLLLRLRLTSLCTVTSRALPEINVLAAPEETLTLLISPTAPGSDLLPAAAAPPAAALSTSRPAARRAKSDSCCCLLLGGSDKCCAWDVDGSRSPAA